MFISTFGPQSLSLSALGSGHHTWEWTYFLCSTHLSFSCCCSSYRRCWTLIFWDLVKPSWHHCRFGFVYDWFDPSSSSCMVRGRSGARHRMSPSGSIESANCSSRLSLFDLSLTRLSSWS
jgi:hypothetical protein